LADYDELIGKLESSVSALGTDTEPLQKHVDELKRHADDVRSLEAKLEAIRNEIIEPVNVRLGRTHKASQLALYLGIGSFILTVGTLLYNAQRADPNEELRADFGGADNESILAMLSTDEGSAVSTSRKTTGYLAAHDARPLFGSDTPSSPTYGNPPGYNGYLEMKQLVAASVSLRQLLAAATIEYAGAFNLTDRYGTVEKGKIANMLLPDKNPLDSVEAWNSIHAIIPHGEWIERSSLSANGR
jgi:imidazolonepropionase-like amidohydrolase